MSIISIILVAISLSMDAFTVSISNGIILKKVKLKDAFKIALYFGTFQFIMPIIGWVIGSMFSGYIESIDHWIAFILLTFIGINMMYESKNEQNDKQIKNPTNNKTILLMAIATSIDALAVGISFAMLDTYILFPSICIGIITFFISFIGVFIGRKVGELFKTNAEMLGGIILILIGLNILREHIYLNHQTQKIIRGEFTKFFYHK